MYDERAQYDKSKNVYTFHCLVIASTAVTLNYFKNLSPSPHHLHQFVPVNGESPAPGDIHESLPFSIGI